MDKRTVLGISLIVVIMVAWGIWMQPSKAEREKAKQRREFVKDSLDKAKTQQIIADSLALVKANTPDTNVVVTDTNIAKLPDGLREAALDSVEKKKAGEIYGPFAAESKGKETFTTIETEKFVLTFSNVGGQLYNVAMLGFQSYNSRYVQKIQDTLNLWVASKSGYSMSVTTGDKVVETSQLYFTTDAKNTKIKGTEKVTVNFRALANNNPASYIEFSYTITGNDYMIDFNVNTVGMEKLVTPGQGDFLFTWIMTTPTQERDVAKERENSNIYYGTLEKDVSQLKGGIKGSEKSLEKDFKFISYKQQFFSAALVAKEGFKEKIKLATKPSADPSYAREYQSELAIPYNYAPSESFAMQMYLGPNHKNTLKNYEIGLAKQINTGSFFLIEWINEGVIFVFNFFDNLGLNYGIIILLLTLIIKLITMPLTYKTFVSSAKMRLLKPDIDALGEKFKPEEALQKQQAVMQLYKKAGVSPLAGCIPALLQMPILFAMIAFFPAAFELRQQGLFWANDLSTYDSILQLPFNIPMYGSHVSLFALLMTGSTILYTQMNSGQMQATGGMQAQQMKIMMYLMPVVFLVFLNSYSAALSYYYLLSNLISILLMLFIRRFMIDEKKLHAQLEENKKKTPKKSKWMSRLEEVQKTRQDQVRQQQSKNAPNKGKKK